MSLLMDALKKAEQDKKDAAKKQEAEAEQGNDELTLESNATQDTEIQASSVNQQDAEKDSALEENEISPSEKSSDPMSLEPFAEKLDDSTESEKVDNINNDYEEKNLTETISEPREKTDKTLQESMKIDTGENEKQDLDKTFVNTEVNLDLSNVSDDENRPAILSTEDVIFDTISSDLSRTFVSAEELARDIHSEKERPTPVAAQTVFSATGMRTRNQAAKWLSFLVLCIVITVSFCVLYYFSITPTNRHLTSPMVAKGVEIEPVAPPIIEIPEDILTDSADVTFSDSLESNELSEAEMVNESLTESLQTQAEESELLQPEDELITTETETISPPSEEMDLTDDSTIGSRDTALAITQQTLPETIEVESVEIEISKSKGIDERSKRINQAYQAFKSGNYSHAENIYTQILEELPGNQDALLGLAAIAHIRGDYQDAYIKYLEVLKLHPANVTAKSALISLNRNLDPVKSESTIKLLLQKAPDAAYLDFTLGTLYATQTRWPEAQRAFFEAFRKDSKNPDYAVNLAISLDRIGQHKTALDYYNQAIALAQNAPSNFDTNSVIARISKISNSSISR